MMRLLLLLHQRARLNKALKPGAKPTKVKDVGKGKRYRESDDVLDPCKIFQRMQTVKSQRRIYKKAELESVIDSNKQRKSLVG